MSKNILIFSDGTGQAGGVTFDENRTNIYKLFRATRCGPDSSVDPSEQVARCIGLSCIKNFMTTLSIPTFLMANMRFRLMKTERTSVALVGIRAYTRRKWKYIL
jgi:Uncharacterized alpha/beta hydrolase domain (DUF2235)